MSRRMTRVIIGCIWAYGACWMVAYLVPGIDKVYFVDTYNWDYTLEGNSWATMAHTVEFWADLFNVVSMIGWCIAFFVVYKIKVLLYDTNWFYENVKLKYQRFIALGTEIQSARIQQCYEAIQAWEENADSVCADLLELDSEYGRLFLHSHCDE